MRIALLTLLLILAAHLPAQKKIYCGATGEANYLFPSRQSYALGFSLNRTIKSDSTVYLNYEHSIGFTNQGKIFLHTNIAIVGWFTLLGKINDRLDSSGIKGGGLLFLFSVLSFLVPNGVTYDILHTSQKKIGIYFNPLGYDYLQVPGGKEISAWDIEMGFKTVLVTSENTAFYFSAGPGFLINVGSTQMRPNDFTNNFLLNAKVGMRFQ